MNFLLNLFVKLLLISYLCAMNDEERKGEYIRTIYKTPEFEVFYSSLPAKTQNKFDFVINVISTIYNVPVKFIKHLEKNIGLFYLPSTTAMLSKQRKSSCLTHFSKKTPKTIGNKSRRLYQYLTTWNYETDRPH